MMIGLKKFLELPESFKPIKLKMAKGSLMVSRVYYFIFVYLMLFKG